MKKWIAPLIVATLLAGAIAFFAKQDNIAPRDIRIAATIAPLHDIAQNVVGDTYAVTLLLPPGASPHFYEFTPRQLRELQNVEVVFAIGHGLDDWVRTIQQSAPNAKISTVDSGIALRTEQDDKGIDPHYWLNFENAVIITENIRDILKNIDPENASRFDQNAEAYITELRTTNSRLKEDLAPLKNRNIITMHDAWYYLADNFDLTVAGTFEPSAGREPSPQYLNALLNTAKEHDVSTFFSEPQLGSAGLRPFLEDAGLAIEVLDPLGGVTGRATFIELMEYNVHKIKKALEHK